MHHPTTTSLTLALLVLCSPTFAEPLPDGEFAAHNTAAKRLAKAKDWAGAASALSALGRDDSPRAVEAIAKLVSKNPGTPLYGAGRTALAAMSSPDAVASLVALTRKGAKITRLLGVDSCGLREDDTTARALIAAIEGAKEEVLRAAVGAVRQRRLESAREPLETLLARAKADSLDAAAARDALRTLNGGDTPRTPTEAGTRTRAEFFGTTLVSDRLVFVIDVSTSMKTRDLESAPGRPTTGGAAAKAPSSGSRVRIERAKFQLARAIDALDSKTRFSIVAYSGYLEDATANDEGYRFPAEVPEDGELPAVIGGVPWLSVFSPKPVKANRAGKAKARAFVSRLRPNGSTFTLRALEVALAMPGVKAIVLLSDGAPTEIEGRRAKALLTAEEILQRVGAANRMRRVRIDTFGIGVEDEEAFGSFLRSLAERNGGCFTDVR